MDEHDSKAIQRTSVYTIHDTYMEHMVGETNARNIMYTRPPYIGIYDDFAVFTRKTPCFTNGYWYEIPIKYALHTIYRQTVDLSWLFFVFFLVVACNQNQTHEMLD